MWLSSMAQGIQAGHAKDELTNKYVYGGPAQDKDASIKVGEMLRDWSLNHKTHIALNGGNSDTMDEMWNFLHDNKHDFPYANFHEDEQSLKGVMTSMALVLPERIYEAASLIRQKKVEFCDSFLYPIDANVNREERDDIEDLCQKYGRYSFFEEDLVFKLNNYRLAS
jgi:hypothetical protein